MGEGIGERPQVARRHAAAAPRSGRVMRRRDFLATAAAAVAGARASRAAAQDEAARSAARWCSSGRARWPPTPFAPPEPAVPEALAEPLGRATTPRSAIRDDRRLFVDPPTGFAVELMHSGLHLQRPGRDLRRRGRRRAQDRLRPGALRLRQRGRRPRRRTPLEFAGFRALTALNQPDVLSPSRSSPARATSRRSPRGQVFGLSARGLAIGTGEAEGEEFPFFRAHWLETPGRGPHGRALAARRPERRPAPTASPSARATRRRSTSRRRSSPARTSPTSASRR